MIDDFFNPDLSSASGYSNLTAGPPLSVSETLDAMKAIIDKYRPGAPLDIKALPEMMVRPKFLDEKWNADDVFKLRIDNSVLPMLYEPRALLTSIPGSPKRETYTPNPDLPLTTPADRLLGYIVREENLTRSRKRPRTRRRQLWRKWLALAPLPGNPYVEPDPNCYVISSFIVGHPLTLAKLATAIQRVIESSKISNMRKQRDGIYADLHLPKW